MATGRRRGRAFVYIALFLILILVLVFAVVRFGLINTGGGGGTTDNTSREVPTPSPTPEIRVVVAVTDIRRGDMIQNHQVETRNLEDLGISRDQFAERQDSFFTDLEQVANGNSRALFDIRAGFAVNRSQVYTPGVSNRLPSFEIPPGKVAISVPMNRLSSVAFGLQRGDHVNVLVSLLMIDLDTNWQSALPNRSGYMLAAGPRKEETQSYLTTRNYMAPNYTSDSDEAISFFGRVELEPTVNNPIWVVPGEPQRPRLVSQTLLQDVVILQLGTFDLSAAPAPAVQSTESADPAQQQQQQQQQQVDPATGQAIAPAAPKEPDIITLIVDPQDAVTLNYLMLAGARLNLVMRSAGDTQQIETEAVTLQFILDQYRIPNPAKLPYGAVPRIDEFPVNIVAFPDLPGPTPTPQPR